MNELKQAILAISAMRENSWDHEKLAYGLSISEAAHFYPVVDWRRPAELLLYGSWNEALDWAKT